MYNPFFPSQRIHKNLNIIDKSFTNWLYGEYDEEKLRQFEFLYSTPLRPYIDYKLDLRADSEYLSRYGMTYENVHDPRKLKATNSAAAFYSSSYRMVSRNIDRLYK